MPGWPHTPYYWPPATRPVYFLRSSRGTASLTRLADLLRLDVREDAVVEILADGPDEVEALHEVATFLTSSTNDPAPHTASDEGND